LRINYLWFFFPYLQQFLLWELLTAEYADFADLTLILFSIYYKSALNLQNQRIQRLIIPKAEIAALFRFLFWFNLSFRFQKGIWVIKKTFNIYGICLEIRLFILT
jgi:hypothetical protein